MSRNLNKAGPSLVTLVDLSSRIRRGPAPPCAHAERLAQGHTVSSGPVVRATSCLMREDGSRRGAGISDIGVSAPTGRARVLAVPTPESK